MAGFHDTGAGIDAVRNQTFDGGVVVFLTGVAASLTATMIAAAVKKLLSKRGVAKKINYAEQQNPDGSHVVTFTYEEG